MTVTPISGRDGRPALPAILRGRLGAPRRRRARTHGTAATAAASGAAATAPALSVAFEVRLVGDSRYSDAIEILDALRRITGRLSSATLELAPVPIGRDARDARDASAADEDAADEDAAEDDAAVDDATDPDGDEGATDEDATECAARRRAVLAAVPPATDRAIRIMPESRTVMANGQPVSLTRVEFDLLIFLAEHPRRVFSRAQLLRSVWGYDHTGERTVDVHIRRLRSKLGDDVAATVRSVGYRLGDEAHARVVGPR